MKERIKKLIITLMSIFKIDDIIVFESNADYSDNSRAFYEYLIAHNYNQKYKIFWFVNDGKFFQTRECYNVKFLTMWHNKTKKTFFQWIHYFWIVKNAKYLISSNRSLLKLNKKTIAINVNHGTPLKKVSDLQIVPKDIDIVLAASDYCIDLISRELHLDKSKIICVGNPRNDIIFEQSNVREKLKEFDKYDKVILWLPTFRKVVNSSRQDSNFEFALGLPIIYTMEDLVKLNEYLVARNTVILFKLHPAQDTSLFKATTLSNIIILNDKYLIEKDVELCELYKITDALITDYSGVYYDYLLTDKMIGFTIDDFEEYKKAKGFVFDNPFDYMAGEKIKNINDLYEFIDDCLNHNDKYKKDRHKMNRLFNKYSDSLSSERLAKYLNL